jgi:hypothetical protein
LCGMQMVKPEVIQSFNNAGVRDRTKPCYMSGPEGGGDATTFPAFRAGFLSLLLPAECYGLVTDASPLSYLRNSSIFIDKALL